MQPSRLRTMVILLAAGALGAALSFGLAVNTRAEPLGVPVPAKQTAGATSVTPLNSTLTTFPDANKENSTNPLPPEPSSPQLIAKQRYARAAVIFPTFCHEWEQKLHDRELNNRAHIHWYTRGGYKVGNYVGYSAVQSCQCKESPNGLPIGKLTYQELNYYMSGRTVDEARHAKPKLIHMTNTLEIFSWDRDRWFY